MLGGPWYVCIYMYEFFVRERERILHIYIYIYIYNIIYNKSAHEAFHDIEVCWKGHGMYVCMYKFFVCVRMFAYV